MIEIHNIVKSFDGKPILYGIDGVFEKGKTNLIIGASGTGKTVLMKCIVGLVDPDEGDVLYSGRDFTHSSRKQKIDMNSTFEYSYNNPLTDNYLNSIIIEYFKLPFKKKIKRYIKISVVYKLLNFFRNINRKFQ